MNKTLGHIIVLILFGINSFSQKGDSVSFECGLSGVVTNDSGRILENVMVRVKEESTGLVLYGITDSNGRYSINLDCYTNDSIYELFFWKESYIFTSHSISIKQYDFKLIFDTVKLKFTDGIICTVSIEDISYPLGGVKINNKGKIELDKLVKLLKNNPAMNIQIGSHTDCVGYAKDNLKLSIKRAKKVKLYLVEKGITPSRLVDIGYGETKPLNDCNCEYSVCSEKDNAENRRTEFRIVAGDNDNSNNSF